MRRLLIADASDVFTDALEEVFRNEFELHICHDGESALEELLSFRPEVLILNLMLPYKDGLTVLQESAHKPQVVLALAPHVPHYVEKAMDTLGIGYILIMPTINTVRVRLMDMVAAATQKSADPAVQTAVHLHALNFPTHLDGYQQLCAAIPIFAANPSMRLSKELYPAVAKQLGLPDPRTVEHSIRKAISAAWKKRDPAVWAKYLPRKTDGTIPCPKNKEFISRIAELLELDAR